MKLHSRNMANAILMSALGGKRTLALSAALQGFRVELSSLATSILQSYGRSGPKQEFGPLAALQPILIYARAAQQLGGIVSFQRSAGLKRYWVEQYGHRISACSPMLR